MKPEFEIYTLVCNRLREKLKEEVNGYVRVGVISNTLQIEIKNGDFKFVYSIENIDDAIAAGYTDTDKVVNAVKKYMTKALIGKYFKKKESEIDTVV